MQKKPYSPPRLWRVTVLTPAIRDLLTKTWAIREGESWIPTGHGGIGRMVTNVSTPRHEPTS